MGAHPAAGAAEPIEFSADYTTSTSTAYEAGSDDALEATAAWLEPQAGMPFHPRVRGALGVGSSDGA